ncbi:MAG: polyphosphate kinase 2 family protein [Planctomycetia bacterium]|nr:polyphosphate kinase 2 family protein [Planctomycetia bacterium]
MLSKDDLDRLRVPTGKRIRLKDYATSWVQANGGLDAHKVLVKEGAQEVLKRTLQELSEAQQLLFANDSWAVLAIFQAMDAAGKDSIIKHVMSGVNPQGCQVYSFKRPSSEDLSHTFLWRSQKWLPERGRIGIFNRSYYEDVLIVKVHPEWLGLQKIPSELCGKTFWQDRYDDINAFERHLTRNGVIVLKFFLHLSKDEQKKRFMERLEKPSKNWKFEAADLAERAYWDEYQEAYESALNATSTDWAPWYVIPADQKWATRVLVADILTSTIAKLKLRAPEPTPAQRKSLEEARKKLEKE